MYDSFRPSPFASRVRVARETSHWCRHAVHRRNSFRSRFAHRARVATRVRSSPRRERTKSSLIILLDAICVSCLSRRASYCRAEALHGSGWKRIGTREVVCFLLDGCLTPARSLLNDH